MKQIFTYLAVVLLGVLSPSLSGRAQNFNGVFKQITPSEELTEGYYIIVNPTTNSSALCGSDMAKKPKKPRGKEEPVSISEEGVIKVIKDPTNSVVWKIQKDNKFLEIPRDYIIYKNEDIKNRNM